MGRIKMKHEIQTKFAGKVTLDRSALPTPGGTKGRALRHCLYCWISICGVPMQRPLPIPG